METNSEPAPSASRRQRSNRLEWRSTRFHAHQGAPQRLWCSQNRCQSGKKGAISNEWLGHSRGGLTSKIHLCVDGNARPFSLIVTAGQCADVTQTAPVLDAICVRRSGRGRPRKRPPRLRVDRAYGARQTRQLIQRRGIQCVCPERADAKAVRLRRGCRGSRPPSFNREDYKGRNVIERAINRLKDFRAVATRYDKRGHNYLAGVIVATILIWLV